MKRIELDPESKAELVEIVQDYFTAELEQELGRFEAEFLIDHLADHMGPFFYNRGLNDAKALLQKTMDDYNDALYGLERHPVRR